MSSAGSSYTPKDGCKCKFIFTKLRLAITLLKFKRKHTLYHVQIIIRLSCIFKLMHQLMNFPIDKCDPIWEKQA